MDESQRIRDEWLALRCQAGDPEGFRLLVGDFQRPLLYYASKVCGDFDKARDVLQESWIRISRSIHQLQSLGALRPWLYRIVHGLAIDSVRRDLARERAEDAVLATADTSIDDCLLLERAEHIHHALDRLKPPHREVLALHFLEDFDIEQIASVLSCAPGTVKSRLHYAKASLRSLLEERS
jgi:RNA polymerase sigma-70 factor (ECF subfamily)